MTQSASWKSSSAVFVEYETRHSDVIIASADGPVHGQHRRRDQSANALGDLQRDISSVRETAPWPRMRTGNLLPAMMSAALRIALGSGELFFGGIKADEGTYSSNHP